MVALAGEDAETVICFESGPEEMIVVELSSEEKIVIAVLIRVEVAAACEDVTGGNPRIEPNVGLNKVALTPD